MIVTFIACQSPGGESTGSEFMPDMAHSIAYEANYSNYYYNNTWSTKEEYSKFAQPRLPVEGTVPRGAGVKTYAYGNTEEERVRATNEIVANPFPITDAGLAEGQELYNTFCGICHGEKGDGAGYLVRDDGAYPVQPANFLLDEFVAASNGRYYHAIMEGKNLMGAYKDKIDYEERWQVIHYIRALQAKDKKLVYSQMENTFNPVFGSPAGEIAVVKEMQEAHNHGHDAGHHEGHESHDAQEGHNHEHDSHDDHNGDHDHDHHDGH